MASDSFYEIPLSVRRLAPFRFVKKSRAFQITTSSVLNTTDREGEEEILGCMPEGYDTPINVIIHSFTPGPGGVSGVVTVKITGPVR